MRLTYKRSDDNDGSAWMGEAVRLSTQSIHRLGDHPSVEMNNWAARFHHDAQTQCHEKKINVDPHSWHLEIDETGVVVESR
jgi:hypothetical protein